ncbi:hypothetical protein CORC01_12027 [Colletotrichum orchidophilum]|uniref:Uncharacterized protein n=1 Tax=Colletotrichum orchidophilum TaxID=1209926 RepID=A0A1G4AUD0_9PEZI|nr:uncharacterized protein CORC01_12027 [Colletotrichum orchidophilum]OHE92693.1 hypothetical protein CORC01_12027 [Colletotrichum orchidophilum]
MDKLYLSPNWLRGGPWNTPYERQPYHHKNPSQFLKDIGFRQPIGERHSVEERQSNRKFTFTDVLVNPASANDFTKRITAALFTARQKFMRLRGQVNVKVILDLLQDQPSLTSADLRPIVNEAYRVALVGDSNLRTAFGINSKPPRHRSADLEEYYRLFQEFMTCVYQRGGAKVVFENATYKTDPFHDSGRNDREQNDEERIDEERKYKERNCRTFLLPFLNQHDLSNPRLLGHLILNRSKYHPSAFALADWEALHLGRASKLFHPKFADSSFIGILTPSEAHEYRLMQTDPDPDFYIEHKHILVGANAELDYVQHPLFITLREQGRLFGWGEGIHFLLTQVMLYRLLYGITKAIAIRSGQAGEEVSSGISVAGDTRLIKAWVSAACPNKIFDLEKEGIVEYGVYIPPAFLTSDWCDDFKAKFTQQLEVSKHHLKSLWHDPFYFQNCITEQFHQHYGHVPEERQTSVPSSPRTAALTAANDGRFPHFDARDIDAKKNLLNDLIRRVARWALFEVEMWQCLLDKLDVLCDLARTKGVPLRFSNYSTRIQIPDEEVREAWVDLGFHARWFVERRINHVVDHGGLVAAEEVRPYFRRDTTWSSLQAGKEKWKLPKAYAGTKINFTQTMDVKWDTQNVEMDTENARLNTENDKMDIGNEEMDEVDPENLTEHLWWSIKNLQVGLASNFSIGTIGLPKLIQALHTKLDERHEALGVQSTVTKDYKGIYLTGLLCHQMQLMHPFGKDLLVPEGRNERRRESPIGPFLINYDDVPFEELVGEKTLRYVQWLLGIVYKPYGDKHYSRTSRLAQKWVRDFWRELCNGLANSDKEFKAKKYQNTAGGGGGNGTQRQRISKPVKPRSCRPPALQRYLGAYAKEKRKMEENMFRCRKICGEIMNPAPPGHLEPPESDPSVPFWMEPPEAVKRIILQMEGTSVTGNRKVDEMSREGGSSRVAGRLKRTVWETMEKIYRRRIGPVGRKDVYDLVSAFGFGVDSRKAGSRESFMWTDRSQFPEPSKKSITIHMPHDTADLKDNQRRSIRDAFEELGITEDAIRKYYHCQGSR